jgi:ribosomal protein L13E
MQMEKKPIIKRQRRGIELIRTGRGYSPGELREAGLNSLVIARARGITVDVLRKTIHSENVEQLKPIVKEVLEPRRTNSKKRSRKATKKGKSEQQQK